MKQPDNQRFSIDGGLGLLVHGWEAEGRPQAGQRNFIGQSVFLEWGVVVDSRSVSWGWYLGIEGRGLTKIFWDSCWKLVVEGRYIG